ncbi:Uncharacterized protein FWK35_00000774 [Aphis craccivora]|uniref:Uncharacterized protein n=1 Tax=Aphis craccivora TaxID=307492 RepID=A0A6G0ZLD5_APHCR|nr:Uncharacterized protein FWK35_00000774 [Aphis craccivora]
MSTLSTFNNITTTTFVKETLSITYANTTSTKTITTTRAPETYTIYYNITKNYHIKTTAAPICPIGQMINSNGGCSPIFFYILHIKVSYVIRQFSITCKKYFSYTMKNRFNFVIAAVVAIVVVVSLANAKYVLQNSVSDNQSRSSKSSVKQFSDTSFPISHIEALEKSTTDATAHTTLAMSPTNTTTVTAVKITNINATKFTEEISKPTTTAYTTSIEETTMVQTTTIASVEAVTENQTSTNQTTEGELLTTRFVIRPRTTKCSTGETENANGGLFSVYSNSERSDECIDFTMMCYSICICSVDVYWASSDIPISLRVLSYVK